MLRQLRGGTHTAVSELQGPGGLQSHLQVRQLLFPLFRALNTESCFIKSLVLGSVAQHSTLCLAVNSGENIPCEADALWASFHLTLVFECQILPVMGMHAN